MYHKVRWTSEKIWQRLRLVETKVYQFQQSLAPFRFQKLTDPSETPAVEINFDDSGWELIEPGSYWIEPQTDFVLRTCFTVPADWDSDLPIALFLPLGEAGDFSHPEALIYVDGRPFVANDRHHQEVQLLPEWRDGNSHSLALHGWSGGTRGDLATRLLMRQCKLVQVYQPLRDFISLARVALGSADCLEESDPIRANFFNALDDAFKILDTRHPLDRRFYDSVPLAYQTLSDGIDRSGAPLPVEVTAVGHAHIDVAWLWTLGQTRRKAGRTFHNVIRLMENSPEFCFTQSQPQLYEFVREDYPELFQTIKGYVDAGRWEPIGGMWVEADCNLSGGESLVRQFLLGRTYFRDHFGESAESPVLWLPDVFGYAWNLPQLIKQAGLDYFFTIKMGWSQYNRLPFDSFWWQGLDGTRVLTHFSPTKEASSSFASTYNATATPAQILSTWNNFQQKDLGQPGTTPPLLMAYGHGDGGGGPTSEMLENIRHLRHFPGMPRVQPGTVHEFFQKLKKDVGARLPTWNDELYLEYHRGTYTTQARNKRANRKSEFLLHDAEFLATVAATLDAGYLYPHEMFDQAWKLLCLNQFHDIIPGSSIGAVYEESLQQYAHLSQLGEEIKTSALANISAQVGGEFLVVNATPFRQHQLAFLPEAPLNTEGLSQVDGTFAAIQLVDNGLLIDPGPLPAYSITAFNLASKPAKKRLASVGTLIVEEQLLENDCLRVELNASGDICRLFDKQIGREILPDCAVANQFQLFEDRPKTPDAWEIDIYYDDKMWMADSAESIRIMESGPLRAVIEINRRIFNSQIVQRICLTHNSSRLDFETTVQWRERHTMLKVAFPINVLSPTATYEIQWGNVERPTHRNTSWDWARFETCAQKWIDLSEGDYGVSLLNDSKYGHDILENILRLTLLRGPTNPDPEADLGEHHFTYSLLPHAGSWDETTISEAYALNDPLLIWTNQKTRTNVTSRDSSLTQWAFITVDKPNVVVETIKQAEDGNGIIVRLYESQRKRGNIILNTAFPIASAWLSNILEEDQEQLVANEHEVSLNIKPYQIVTIRLLSA